MKPTKEKINTSELEASIEKFPSKSVEVPVLVPLITTLTPGSGTPAGSTTDPLRDCCAVTNEPTKNNKHNAPFLKSDSVFVWDLKIPK